MSFDDPFIPNIKLAPAGNPEHISADLEEKNKLILQLKNEATLLKKTPTFRNINEASKAGRTDSPKLFKKIFGSHNKALVAAGLAVENIRAHHNKEDLIIKLQQEAKRLGRSPTFKDLGKSSMEHRTGSATAYSTAFGSLNNALLVADLEITKLDMRKKSQLIKEKYLGTQENTIKATGHRNEKLESGKKHTGGTILPENIAIRTKNSLQHLEIEPDLKSNGEAGVNLEGIVNYPPLTKAEERELAQKMEKGDEVARNILVLSNLPLLIDLINKNYKKFLKFDSPLTFQDLFQEGVLGMYKATEKFDWEKDIKFFAYAGWWAKQKIGMLLNLYGMNRPIRIPDNIYRLFPKYKKTVDLLVGQLQRHPSNSEVANQMNISEKTAVKLSEGYSISGISIYKPVYDENDKITLGDTLSNEKSELLNDKAETALKDTLHKVILENFSPRNQQILISLYEYKGKVQQKYKEIAEKFGLTPWRIHQIEEEMLSKLKNNKKIQNLKKEILDDY